MKECYFRWLGSLIDTDTFEPYGKLVDKLFETDFIWTIRMDKNRSIDGLLLRKHFAYENYISDSEMQMEFGGKECSILEMMIGLAYKCNEQILYDPEKDLTGEIFREMVDSLGLSRMDDSNYDEDEVNDILESFLKRKYEKDGHGGLFSTSDPSFDMPKTQIWYQMMKHISEDKILYSPRWE